MFSIMMMGDLGDEYIQITVTSPHKVGDGMSSFMAYTIKTTTNLSYFKVMFIVLHLNAVKKLLY